MKTWELLLVAILLFAGCIKDDSILNDSEKQEKLNIRSPFELNADCKAVCDQQSGIIQVTVPGQGNYYAFKKYTISGTISRIGKIDSEKSYYECTGIKLFTDNSGHTNFLNTGIGKVVAASGDGFEFNFISKQRINNVNYTGNIDIIPGTGTGKFKGCYGSCEMVGAMDNATNENWFILEGYLCFEDKLICRNTFLKLNLFIVETINNAASFYLSHVSHLSVNRKKQILKTYSKSEYWTINNATQLI